MTGERWRRIEEVFGEAVDLPATDREAFVTARCGDDTTLRDEILGMIAADGDERIHAVVGEAASELVRDSAAARVGSRIGAYRIVDVIGHGGMGCVYRAERADGEFQRVVAVKLLDHTGSRATARFRDERQILAKLAHPGIVRLVDGGTTEDGTPYLVMDHVEGVKISEGDRSVDACVQLVAELCDALAYAHGLGVIHRDIKPSNILVGEHGPRLLDFGIAKLVEPGSGREAETRTGAALLTPEYASPEQARGEPVTAATDIYSLGAVLYELIARRRPLAPSGNMLEVLRVISEVEPPRPSSVAPAGRTISRDLDRIVLGALRKEPKERYASAAAFAADLRAYLAGENVSPPRARRSRAWWLAVPAALALATVGLFALRPHPWIASRFHTLAVHVSGEPSLAPAAERMAVRTLRDSDRRFDIADDPSAADVTAELVVRQDGDTIVLGGELVATRPFPLADVRARSVESALAMLAPKIRDAIGAAPRGPDEEERAAMARIGATSVEEYRSYHAIDSEAFRTTAVDLSDLEHRLEAILAQDPGWAHPWALLISLTRDIEHDSVRAKAALGATTRDPSGLAVIEAWRQMANNGMLPASRQLEAVVAADPDDLVAALELHLAYDGDHRGDENVALLRRLYERHPEQQWGADLMQALREIGRSSEAEPMVREWAARAPDSEQALISLARIEIEAHHPQVALAVARKLLVLRDDAPQRIQLTCDLLITAEYTHEAAPFAEKLLRGNIEMRAIGLQRMATIEILEGRFGAAFETLFPAGPEGDVLARKEALHEIGRDLALELHRADKLQQFDDALDARAAEAHDIIGPRQRGFERALLHGECPNIEAALVGVNWPVAGNTRDDAKRSLMRAASTTGCSRCRDVIAAGVRAVEADSRSAFAFAACAEAEGELSLANDTFASLREIHLNSIDPTNELSPFVWISARFRHARVLERLGRTDEARLEYQSYLQHWDHADAPLPELAEARAAIARLTK